MEWHQREREKEMDEIKRHTDELPAGMKASNYVAHSFFFRQKYLQSRSTKWLTWRNISLLLFPFDAGLYIYRSNQIGRSSADAGRRYNESSACGSSSSSTQITQATQV
jgi:hypothetical protein